MYNLLAILLLDEKVFDNFKRAAFLGHNSGQWNEGPAGHLEESFDVICVGMCHEVLSPVFV